MDFIVQFKNIVKRYGEFEAVRGLTLDIPRGGIFALLGPNGAGKTTLIKLLMGMLRPTSGDLTVGVLNAYSDGVEVKRIVGWRADHHIERVVAVDAQRQHVARRRAADGLNAPARIW